MGEVIISFKIYPKNVEANLKLLENEIAKKLPSRTRISRSVVEPIAFGLNALMLDIVVPEEEEIADRVEEVIRSNSEVQGLEIVSQRRALRI